MEGLFSFLIFAALFYLLMRFGCGAHMIHGHKGNHNQPSENNPVKYIDPVCGVEVDIEKGYGKMHEGSLYRFCSRSCLDQFETTPDKYIHKNERIES